jgi:hypothetical protein
VNSGVAAPSDTLQLLSIYQPTPGTFQFWIDSTLAATLTANIPTLASNLALGFRVETLTTAAASVRVNKFVYNATVGGVSAGDSQFEV